VDALGLISGLALEWKSHASKIYFGVKDSPWQTENVFELFQIYSEVVFLWWPGVLIWKLKLSGTYSSRVFLKAFNWESRE